MITLPNLGSKVRQAQKEACRWQMQSSIMYDVYKTDFFCMDRAAVNIAVPMTEEVNGQLKHYLLHLSPNSSKRKDYEEMLRHNDEYLQAVMRFYGLDKLHYMS